MTNCRLLILLLFIDDRLININIRIGTNEGLETYFSITIGVLRVFETLLKDRFTIDKEGDGTRKNGLLRCLHTFSTWLSCSA